MPFIAYDGVKVSVYERHPIVCLEVLTTYPTAVPLFGLSASARGARLRSPVPHFSADAAGSISGVPPRP